MKRIICVFFVLLCLCGCGSRKAPLDGALSLRQQLLQSQGCAFDAEITADYGKNIYVFKMGCAVDRDGNLRFTVKEPETISGITGIVDAASGKVTFGDCVLAFPQIADGQITPVGAPWLFVRALKGGYMASCGKENDGYILNVYDSYEDGALDLQVKLNGEYIPQSAEFLWKERRFLSISVSDFTIL